MLTGIEWDFCVEPSPTPTPSFSRTPSPTALPQRACLEVYVDVSRMYWAAAQLNASLDGGGSWTLWPMELTADGMWWFVSLATTSALQFKLSNGAGDFDMYWDPGTMAMVDWATRSNGGVYRLGTWPAALSLDPAPPRCGSASAAATATATGSSSGSGTRSAAAAAATASAQRAVHARKQRPRVG